MKNGLYQGAFGKWSTIDLSLPEIFNGRLIIFCHGFMGYKDWGPWGLVEEYFHKLGYGFCKFNFSHNGTTESSPISFEDLESFSTNSYYKEHLDLRKVLDFVQEMVEPYPEIHLIGHSRGGAIALSVLPDPRIKRVVTWAAVSNPKDRFPQGEKLDEWEKEGEYFILNSRTKQKLGLKYQSYLEFYNHSELFNFENNLKNINTPMLFIHGKNDETVSCSDAHKLAQWSGQQHIEIPNTGHTFGGKEPWDLPTMPLELQKICDISAHFFLAKQT